MLILYYLVDIHQKILNVGEIKLMNYLNVLLLLILHYLVDIYYKILNVGKNKLLNVKFVLILHY